MHRKAISYYLNVTYFTKNTVLISNVYEVIKVFLQVVKSAQKNL